MPDVEAVLVPISELTKKQMLRFLTKGHILMSDELSHLSASVDKELADDSAQNELIAELKRQLGEAQQAAQDAAAGQAGAEARLSDALSAAEDAANRLDSNDAPAEEPGEGA